MKSKHKAIEVRQGSLRMFTASLEVKDILEEGFVEVKILNRMTTNEGESESKFDYQRCLDERRANAIANDIIAAYQNDGKVPEIVDDSFFMPSSIFLATEKEIEFDGRQITIDAKTIPFSIVDGQHRIASLRKAIQKAKADSEKKNPLLPKDTVAKINDIQLPVIIADNLEERMQAAHFLVVNSTQKNVDKSVQGRIRSFLSKLWTSGAYKWHAIPHFVKSRIEKGEDVLAESLIEKMTASPPWKDRVVHVNATRQEKKNLIKGAIAEHSLSGHIQSHIVPLKIDYVDWETVSKSFANYWKALKETLDEGEAVGLYTSNAFKAFCLFFPQIMRKLCNSGKSYDVENYVKCLNLCFEHLDSEFFPIGTPTYWIKDGAYLDNLSFSTTGKIASGLTEALNKFSLLDR